MGRRRSIGAVAAAAMMLAASACSGRDAAAGSATALGDDAITVGSFDFAESVVVAEVYAAALERSGYKVERALALGPREFVAPALRQGLVELVPEYAGSATQYLSLGTADAVDDVSRSHEELVKALGDSGLVALAAAPAQNANTFVVTSETAHRLGVETLSDLAPHAAELTFGGPPECATRPLCLGGLSDVYGLEFGAVVALDTGGLLTRQALQAGDVDVALLFTTDPALATDDLVELVDDRGLQPAENVTPVVRSEIVTKWGEAIVGVIDAVSRHLTTAAVRGLNERNAGADADPAAIATNWLQAEGLT